MKLTQEQLIQIQEFIKKKGFTYLDVQMEILDHVASQVEEKMTENPDLELNDVIRETHRSFGVMGFSGIEEGITKVLNKKYRIIFFGNMLSFFKLRYLFLTIFAFYFLYKIQYVIVQRNLMFPLFIVAMVGLIFILYIQYFKSYSLKNYLAFRISAGYLSLLGGVLSFGSFLRNVFDTPHFYFNININYLIISLMIGLFYIYAASAIKTAKLGITDSKLLMEKYNMVNA